MSVIDVILIGVVLSIDACAITISNCATYKKSLTLKQEWAMPIAFALFQGIMPLIGYFIGCACASFISSFTKYLTCAIFFILAIKIVIDIIKENKEVVLTKEDVEKPKAPFTIWLVVVQAVATSIDALAVGVTFIDLNFHVAIAVSLIAVVTFILVLGSVFFGKTLGKLFGKYAEWVGAGILFILSIKALLEALGVL